MGFESTVDTVWKSHLKDFAESLAPRMVEIVGGDRSRIPELTEFLRQGFNEISDRHFVGSADVKNQPR